MLAPMEYPALQTAADKASAKAQSKFILLNISQLTILTFIAFVSGVAPEAAEHQRSVAIATFVLMLVAMLITTILRFGRFDDHWFRCRAFAENVKRATWFFAMADSGEEAKAEFIKSVEVIRDRLKEELKIITEEIGNGETHITSGMLSVQATSLSEKVKYYREHRVQDQRVWYRAKARANSRRERFWLNTIFFTELAALGYAALQASVLWKLNAVGGIAAASAAFIAWMQTKRFSDLGTSYAIAAGDLDRINLQNSHIDDVTKLRGFVAEVEEAVSREHRIWLERRGVDC